MLLYIGLKVLGAVHVADGVIMANEDGALPAAGLLRCSTAQEPGGDPEDLSGMACGLAEPWVGVAVLIDLKTSVEITSEFQWCMMRQDSACTLFMPAYREALWSGRFPCQLSLSSSLSEPRLSYGMHSRNSRSSHLPRHSLPGWQ